MQFSPPSARAGGCQAPMHTEDPIHTGGSWVPRHGAAGGSCLTARLPSHCQLLELVSCSSGPQHFWHQGWWGETGGGAQAAVPANFLCAAQFLQARDPYQSASWEVGVPVLQCLQGHSPTQRKGEAFLWLVLVSALLPVLLQTLQGAGLETYGRNGLAIGSSLTGSTPGSLTGPGTLLARPSSDQPSP